VPEARFVAGTAAHHNLRVARAGPQCANIALLVGCDCSHTMASSPNKLAFFKPNRRGSHPGYSDKSDSHEIAKGLGLSKHQSQQILDCRGQWRGCKWTWLSMTQQWTFWWVLRWL
jgi:Spy/CpxP family protein refolding chaperone